MSTGPKSTRGGARPGAGRPPGTTKGSLTAYQVEKMLDELAKVEAVQGETLDSHVLAMLFKPDTPPNTKVAGWAKFKELTMARIQEGGEADKLPPVEAGLPDVRPDPAKVIPIRES